MSTMMDGEDYRIREAIRIFQERPKRPFSACACLGPANGEPECFCRMASIVKVEGIYYQISGDELSGITARHYQNPPQQ
ncbi:hypothetical protein [Acidithiobacillus thiooxidans]|uniref:Uncharacterized protein n=1 Tax=Acidithiobacillus thiooxidans ATCC 19377 TaxID=637390 RepID=A0A543Q1R8_ACITH|nr:hypothetical protein [Acidithiobacillus thiooxidans]MDX5935682.1 hypothetical protein [Acidithiobacillus thiooxidans]TQN50220.1 hypothetical protein DLNHIDIE_00072 [Acidithiobacillus thiooxidans ATCC 19377]